LDFLNDGLWMRSDSVDLGGVKASKLAAAIPDYSKEKLLIDADTIRAGIAGGADSSSVLPIGVSKALARVLVDVNKARTTRQRLT
ncbi:hypothetical protein MJM83_33055, partial [Salmonella enterica subsp. enterica serovar Montevideo]|nr:hypothetical protein [Salmonella enterica subsp. enterica serovar Montevideo]